MCGLVAVISRRPEWGFHKDVLDAFRNMLLVDTLRGKDSTGTFSIENNGNVYIAKDAVNGGQFIFTNEFEEQHAQMFKNGFAWVGHNRAATRGAVNDKNAHPFWKDDTIVMVHNGTFSEDHKKHADTEVDSEALCHLLAAHGVDEVEKVFNKIKAAYAVIWYDARDKSINFIRNSQRPLYFVTTERAHVICSEPGMIAFSLGREGVKIPDDNRIALVKEHLHVKVTRDGKDGIKVQNIELNIKDSWDSSNYNNYSGSYNSITNTQKPTAITTPLNNVVKEVVAESVKKDNIIVLPSNNRKPLEPHVVMDKLYEDSGPAHDLIPFKNHENAREFYTHGRIVEFEAKNVIPVADKDNTYILYGKMVDDPDIYAASVITETDFTKLIDLAKERQVLKCTVEYVHWKNCVTTVDSKDWKGISLVHVKDPQPVFNVGDVCGC